VLSAIVRGAKTGEMDDGNIFVIPIESMVKVCTADYSINAVTKVK
jgi:nitrogen regulatory protein PII